MKGNRETETFTIISTLDTSAMPEAPEEVAKPGESQGYHRQAINALPKREANAGSWLGLYYVSVYVCVCVCVCVCVWSIIPNSVTSL